ncbi:MULTISPECIES: GNAT family N-acetyltransferase [unclassified Leucobacter]|uniref:GNAT family N-acetyltransferase n=1 Tax=unclassified Leucobacter TaxID=2621730 RepID=UPI00165E7789|nr:MULTISPECIES: GNAT family protein [unclassified Leucobacter]MBC9928495.1 GNAT family N-acetyltransferase [Leucobacter sp. cx-169]
MPHRPLLENGRVSLEVIRPSHAAELEFLLRENRRWLQQWEASHPSGLGVVPGSTSMKPGIKSMRAAWKRGTGLPFVIRYDHRVVGQLSVSEISGGALRSCQIGYWVSEAVAGRGVTPTAVALVTDHLLGARGLHRVEICIRPENQASLRVIEKLGFRYEGRRERYIYIDGAWRDHDCFALTSEEARDGVISRIVAGVRRADPNRGAATP